ncbi:MAG: glycine cleavage system aminomethyltransferase GcvT [Candidatus Latescibacterota bacterium]
MDDYSSQLNKTPLAGEHEALGARMVPFAGYWMPVSYGSILDEHRAVREQAGLFDVSHMGEVRISGPASQAYLNNLITNDCSSMEPGGVQYTVMCREDGTTVDDLLVCKMAHEEYLLVVNAANTEKDIKHMLSVRDGEVRVENISDRYALLALQGPLSREVLGSCPFFASVVDELKKIRYYRFFQFVYQGANIIVSRTGYTGELGYELFIPPALAPMIWRSLFESGKSYGIRPIGLAARDTLRFEASFCLYGQELDDHTTPLQAGLGWVVNLRKEAFIGKDALVAERRIGPNKSLIGLQLDGRAIARQGFPVMEGERVVGRITSGNFSPTLKKSLCMAFVESGERSTDYFTVEVRDKRIEARRHPLPFYKSRAR